MGGQIGALFCPFCRLFGRDSADSERLHRALHWCYNTCSALTVVQYKALWFQNAAQSVSKSRIECNVTILSVALKTAVHLSTFTWAREKSEFFRKVNFVRTILDYTRKCTLDGAKCNNTGWKIVECVATKCNTTQGKWTILQWGGGTIVDDSWRLSITRDHYPSPPWEDYHHFCQKSPKIIILIIFLSCHFHHSYLQVDMIEMDLQKYVNRQWEGQS